ncbi:MAG: hypothetical protein AAF741_12535 [Bacteroidota bacterium]
MEENRKEVDRLIDALDKSANANTYWLTLPISDSIDTRKLGRDLINLLELGDFHNEMVREDIYRELGDYTEYVFTEGMDEPILKPKPGNVWNGKEVLKMSSLAKIEAKNLLNDILTNGQKYFSKSSLGTALDQEEASKIIDAFFTSLDRVGTWIAVNIKPNFLNTTEDYENSNHTILGYFENSQRDFALGFVFKNHMNILLVNGYG